MIPSVFFTFFENKTKNLLFVLKEFLQVSGLTIVKERVIPHESDQKSPDFR
jgi:hypothetical protein